MEVVRLTTNVEAWRAVHEGIAAGETVGRIAARHDLSLQMAYAWARMDRPPRVKRLNTQRGATARRPLRMCTRCGESAIAELNRSHRCAGRWCGPCAKIVERERAQVDARIEALRAWADREGVTPTVSQARDLFGISRSRAGELVLLAFGPAPRGGNAPRPWPPASTTT